MLTEYLRAAVPRLDGSANTLGQELELVHAYLELMQMRMPDRLQFDVQADSAALEQAERILQELISNNPEARFSIRLKQK